MDVVSDDDLVLMARRPPGELFLLLRRTTPFLPLVALLSVLPSLYALRHHTQSEADALWGLRHVSLSTAPRSEAALRTDLPGAASLLRWQPPLGSWVQGGLIRLTGARQPFWLMAVSYASVAGAVGMAYALLRVLADERTALWGALLAAFLPNLVGLATSCSPAALGVASALVAMWGFLRHLERGTRRVSLRLFLGGCGLATCLLAAGPLAIGVTLILLLHVCGLRGETLSRRRWAGPKAVSVWSGWPALKSLVGLLALAVPLGGWWVGLVGWRLVEESAARDGAALTVQVARRHAAAAAPFLDSWLWGTAAPALGDVPPPPESDNPPLDRLAVTAALRLLEALGPMAGLCLFGWARAAASAFLSGDEPRRRSRQLLTLWTTCAAIGWLVLLSGPDTLPHAPVAWEAFLSLGFVACGAFAIEDVVCRRMSFRVLVLAVGTGLGLQFLIGSPVHSAVLQRSLVLNSVLIAGALLVAIVYRLFLDPADREMLLRVLLRSFVVAQLAAAAIAGTAALRRDTPDQWALNAFRRGLPPSASVAACTVLGDASNVPYRLRLVLRSAWPHARLEFVDSWEGVLTQLITRAPDPAGPRTVVVEWTSREARPSPLPAAGLEVTAASTPQFFESRPLRAWLVAPVKDGSASRLPIAVGGL